MKPVQQHHPDAIPCDPDTGIEVMVFMANALHQMDDKGRANILTVLGQLIQALDQMPKGAGPMLSYDRTKGEMKCSFTAEGLAPVVVPVSVPKGATVQ